MAQHPRLRFVARELLRLLISGVLLVTVSFLVLHLVPGDPVRNALGAKAPPQLVEAKRHELGLDQPLIQQYGNYWADLARGDLGRSITTDEPVGQTIADRFPATLELAGLAFLLVIALAFPIGLAMAALTRDGMHRGADLTFTGTTGLLNTIPDFVLGTALVAVFAVGLEALPVAGRSGPSSFVLPVIALGLGAAATLARVVRIESAKVLGEDYVRTARSKGLPAWRIYFVHTLPNAVTGSLTIGGLVLCGLVGGTVLVENVFSWPGLGNTIVEAVLNKDYPLVQGVVLVLGGAVLIINTAVDLALAMLDPRSELHRA